MERTVARHAGGSDSFNFVVPVYLARRMNSGVEDAMPSENGHLNGTEFLSESTAVEEDAVFLISLVPTTSHLRCKCRVDSC